MTYEIYNGGASNYLYFTSVTNNWCKTYGFDNCYALTSLNDQLYLERFQQKQKNGVISENLLNSIAFYDIQYQRLFIVKRLLQIGLDNINMEHFEKLLKENADFETIIRFVSEN